MKNRPSSDRGMGQESVEAQRIPLPQWKLGTAFETPTIEGPSAGEEKGRRYQGETRAVFSYELRQMLNFRAFAYNVMGGEPPYRSDDDLTRLDENVNLLLEVIDDAPVDAKSIRLRQEFLSRFLQIPKSSKETRIDRLEKMRKCVDLAQKILHLKLDLFNADDVNTIQKKYDYLVSDRPLNEIRKLKDEMKLLGSDTTFGKQIWEHCQRADELFEEYQKKLRTSSLAENIKTCLKCWRKDVPVWKPMKKRGWKKPEDFRKHCEGEMSDKGQPLNELNQALDDISRFIRLAQVVEEGGLRRVEIVEPADKVIEFKGARHPRLAKQLKKKTVPVDIHSTAELPITVITGHNGTGKSKLVESVIYNAALAQAMGYALVESGIYSPRSQVIYMQAMPGERDEFQYSRGQREMRALAEKLKFMRWGNLVVMDEVLTSTDSLGAIVILLSVLEENYEEKGGISFLAVHSRDLEEISAKKITPLVHFIRAKMKDSQKTYEWEEGVGRADPIALARECKLSEGVVKRARELLRALLDPQS